VNEIVIARAPGKFEVTAMPASAEPGAELPRRKLSEERRAAHTRTRMRFPGTPPEQGLAPDLEVIRHARIACVIPAYNEEETIAEVLESLLSQTRLPDVIHVVINNTDDDTLEIASKFAGRHQRMVKGNAYETVVHVHDMGVNPDKKVGALNFGFRLSRGYDYILGVDGDTTVDRKAVEWLEKEIVEDPRIGGISAIYSIDKTKIKGAMAKFLVAGQRAQFAGFNMDNLLHGRNMAVLGGQCSIFSIPALETVMTLNHQNTPWVRDSEVEDSKLSLQIRDAGYSTKISARARANVGAMTTMRALHGQQVKWNFGAIDLMWPGQRGDTKGRPLHPNLRLRWFENISMLINISTRMGFMLLLAAALSIHAFVFNPIWLIPPAIAMLLNLRLALAMHDKSASDLLHCLLIPTELYMWVRIGHFLTAWVQFFARVEKDNWAAQAAAEKGRGSSYVFPAIIFAAVFGVLIFAWGQQSIGTQASILSLGWPALYLVTVVQTLFMGRKVFRRQRGFTV
jgi:cellulose synthase/poly-beta-1,6-N-acetylglucosamine synthase-like glycosyltransferase